MNKVASIVLNNFKNDARVLKEAMSLQNNGYDVNVVALHETELQLIEIINGIKVERISLVTKDFSKIFIVQLLKYLEFSLKVIKKYRNMDIIHCNDLAPLPIAVAIKLLFNRDLKIIYDAHEHQTERNGMNRIRRFFSKIVERIMIKQADLVITVSNGIANEYIDKYHIRKPTVIYNCPSYAKKKRRNLFREKFGISKDEIIYLYQGGLFKGRGLEVTLDTFAGLSDKKSVLVVIGFGELEQLVKEYSNKYDNIYFHEAVSPVDLLEYTSSADVGLCLIENTSLSYYYCMPNKFFEYSMMALPTIVNNLYELNKMITKYNNGWVIDELSVKVLSDKITMISEMKGSQTFSEKGINAMKLSETYNWEKQEDLLIKEYNNIKDKQGVNKVEN